MFGEVNRFVFELLQNADDASQSSSEIAVEFKLRDNYLIFSHDGKHFTAEDVKGISGIGNRSSQKDQNIEKTGYKGIGFKSVFGSSDYVHIISGGFSFRFDKNFDGFKGSNAYPWQVVPIWTDDPVDEASGHYDSSRVNTIIKVHHRTVIKNEIVKIFEDCQILLFLRKVKTVCFFDNNEKIFEISKKSNDGIVTLAHNAESVSSWLINEVSLPISQELSKRLSELSPTECPQKLKDAKATKLTFAAQVLNGRLVATKRTVIYSYLPTKAHKGFAFLINGDFLTNAERTELMPNVWNEFLFAEIAMRKLIWFKELQESPFRYELW